MVRLLLLLLGNLTAGRARRQQAAWSLAGGQRAAPAPGALYPGQPSGPDGWPPQPGPLPPRQPGPAGPDDPRGSSGRRRRRFPRWLTWTAVAVVAGLVFRRAIASVALAALSAAFHLAGIGVHLPSVKFAWPWQTITAGSATNTDLGPWVLQKIEGISRPALGEARFSFLFSHRVSKNIGPWPCWYAATFYAVGHASATVDLNPGAAWWAPAANHYRLRVLSRPGGGRPGHVTVTMVLPRPRLPQSAHEVTIDNIPSKPVATRHSWTYPGFGCGVLVRPQFPQSTLYAQAQDIAFYKSSHVPQVTRPLIRAAETEATRTIRGSFIQPAVNAFGYTLDRFAIRWAAAP